jgi:hypothetical protein
MSAARAAAAVLCEQLSGARGALAAEVRGRRWLREAEPELAHLEVEDAAILEAGPARFALVVLRFARSGERYFAPLALAAGPGLAVREASHDPALVAALLGAMAAGREVPTARGGAIAGRAVGAIAAWIDAADPGPAWSTPFQEGRSSNCLTELRRGPVPGVCKVYKRLGPEAGREVEAMALLGGTGLVPELLGAVSYRRPPRADAPDDREDQLAMVSTLVDGEPIYLPLSRHLRELSAEVVRAPERAAGAIAAALRELAPLCRGVGERLRAFHGHLNARARAAWLAPAPTPQFDRDGFTAPLRARCARVRACVQDDPALPAPLRARGLAQLDRIDQELLAPARPARLPALEAAIPHGDLHLSHLLVRAGSAAAGDLCLLDVSPRELRPDAPAYRAQHVQQDVLSLYRSLQYFAFDEIMDAIKDVIAVSQLAATYRVLAHPAQLPRPCQALLAVLATWTEGVFGAIEGAYRTAPAAAAPAPPAPVLEPAWGELFYASRLLHELDYNYSHDREFFKYCDFYYLLQQRASFGAAVQ